MFQSLIGRRVAGHNATKTNLKCLKILSVVHRCWYFIPVTQRFREEGVMEGSSEKNVFKLNLASQLILNQQRFL